MNDATEYELIDCNRGTVLIGYCPDSTLYEVRDAVTRNLILAASSMDAVIEWMDGTK